jgi:flagellar hook assembly protein FlgD
MKISKLTIVYNLNTYIDTVMEANAHSSRTATARQWISKHVSLIVEAVFSVWSLQSCYKEVQNSSREVKSRVKDAR